MVELTMKQLRTHQVRPGTLTVWWLGQTSFLVKSAGGTLVAIDPYLSNASKADGERYGLDTNRRFPPPITPEQLVGVDLIALTHSHTDHMDPETLGAYRAAGGEGPYLAPPETWERLQEKVGVPERQIIMTWPNKTHVVGDLVLRATFALALMSDDMTHVGYLISARGGPTFYFTGDTGYEELVALGVRDHHPDVMFTVINGGFRNLCPAEAARLARQIDAKVVIPSHHDLFLCSTMPAQMLHTNLVFEGIGDRYRTIERAQPYTYPETVHDRM
jgi:L-ascorbate 6-phosphate lactonase